MKRGVEMRNPKWKSEEVILLVDFYFKFKIRECEPNEEDLMILRKYLLNLKCHKEEEIGDNFRNITGLRMKLYNLREIDESCELPSLKKYSMLDKEIFERYKENIEELERVAYRLYLGDEFSFESS